MKKLYLTNSVCLLVLLLFFSPSSFSQCPAGFTQAALNWDNLDYLKQDPTYISASQAQTQYFAFGTNRITVNHNYNTANEFGEDALHTADAGSYGAGDDVHFMGNGTVTLTFQSAVQNVKFSVYDIDYNQRVTITAVNGIVPQLITMVRQNATQLTIVGSGTVSAMATANATYSSALNAADGTINVDIAGPVTSVTIAISQTGTKTTGPAGDREDGSFWISDIAGCVNTAAFPNSYYAISQPFTNQPGYVLAAINNTVLYIDPATGKAKTLFTDPSGNNINSMGYDPYNKLLYYTYSLTNGGSVNPNNKSIQKYNVNTGDISTVVSNVNTLGIPTYGSGVESGGAAFYDGAFYIGIEGIDGDESKVWRIDFDGAFNPVVGARQVFSLPTDFHDWGDFGISNGILYDFDGKTSSNENIYHYDLSNGIITNTYSSGTLGFIPRQFAIDWAGTIYNVGTAATSSSGTIVPYSNGTINPALQYTITTGATTPSGSWGDAAEAFRPKADFGDAPATYDPNPLSPALHETVSNLYLGNGVNVEWNKIGSSALANDDVDDGLPFVQIITSGSTYYTDVNVFNNTGANATLCAWVDFNNDGVFDAGEGISQTISSSASVQTVNLFWSGIGTSLPINSYTFIRVRITSAVNGMTAANPTGFFHDGEVEDYRVVVNSPILPTNLFNFSAKKLSNAQVQLNWKMNYEEKNSTYELQKSIDGKSWIKLQELNVTDNRTNAFYQYNDNKPHQPETYYRLVMIDVQGTPRYSSNKKVQFTNTVVTKMFPNPASDVLNIDWYADAAQSGTVIITSANGKKVFERSYNLQAGGNAISVSLEAILSQGVHHVTLITGNQKMYKSILIQHQK